MTDRILIKENDLLFEQMSGDLAQYQKPLERVVEAFEALKIGDFTQEDFEGIQKGEVSVTIETYKESLFDELDRAKITNEVLRENMLVGTEKASNEFVSAVESLLTFEVKTQGYFEKGRQTLPLQFISYSGGKFTISEAAGEALKEAYCRTYMETEDQKNLYAAVNNFCDAYKGLIKQCEDMKLRFTFTSTYDVLKHFTFDIGPNVIPDTDQIKRLCLESLKAKQAK